MDSSRLPPTVWKAHPGLVSTGSPKKWFKDSIKNCLKQLDMPPGEIEARALVRAEWRSLITRACTNFESNRRERIMTARDWRKAADPLSAKATLDAPMPPSLRLKDRARKPHHGQDSSDKAQHLTSSRPMVSRRRSTTQSVSQ